MKLLCAFLFLVFITFFTEVNAQILFALEPCQNALTSSIGLNKKEPFLTAGFARGFHISLFKGKIKDDITLFIDLTDESNLHTDNAFRFIYGGQGSIFKKKYFSLLFRKTFGVFRYNLLNGNKVTYLGAEFELMPGWYKPKYFIALDLYYGDNLRGHAPTYQMDDGLAKDIEKGWFKPKWRTFRAGFNLGYHLNTHFTIFGNIDLFVARPHKGAYSPEIPLIFGFVGINYIFPQHKIAEVPVDHP